MTQMKFAIAMAIHNKNECLANTLVSIKKQNKLDDIAPHFVFIVDGCSPEQDPLPIIEKVFPQRQFTLHRNEKSIGFQHLPAQMLELIGDDIDYAIFQSCDVIWYDPNLLLKIVAHAEAGSLDQNVVIPSPVLNLAIPPEVHEDENGFLGAIAHLLTDKSLYGEPKKPAYGYLGAIKKENLKKVLDMRTYNSAGACDLVLKEHYGRAGIGMQIIDAPVVHQKHAATIYECTSINECTHPCVIRRGMIKKGMKFPFEIGYYNSKTGRWTDHPSYH
tara:strand:+ start:6225 stop:7046 length:822 start_codon:yes stop_codon:yes gene_type:complete